jgi:Kef-type K+ transport system membrane component KefB
MQNLIPIILIAVAAATALNVFLRRFNMPTVVGYLIQMKLPNCICSH